MGFVDLHTHTRASDGIHAPADNVKMAREAGLSAVAITDHDTIAGLAEAMEEGRRQGIGVVPGVEISTVENGQDIHILGYYFDLDDELFRERLEGLRATRNTRNEMMIARLRELGLDISMEELIAVSKEHPVKDGTIGRAHMADLLVKKGYAESVRDAFDRYIGTGGQAYVNPPRITPFQAVDWIREAGGKAVIAHPGLYDDDALVARLIEYGVDGIEAYHSDHSPEMERKYAQWGARAGLVITAGSDFHGERHGAVFHGHIGSRTVIDDVLVRLQERGH